MAELQIKGMTLGHVGDGNFHSFISVNTSDEEELRNYREYTERLVKQALSAHGTCTGEHGIGLGQSF